MHNFESEYKLESSGKRFPVRGKLVSLSGNGVSLFGYLSDDYTFAFVELKQSVLYELNQLSLKSSKS